MAYPNPNSFYSHYRAPRSAAFGGTLGKPKPKAPVAPQTAPTTPGTPASAPAGVPKGFTVTPSNLPPDPAYQQTIGGLGTTLTDTLAGLTSQRTQGLAAYGYTEDPTTGALAFDPNNPYSQAALALKSYNQAKTGNSNSYAASGQLYAGSLQNAQNAASDSYGAENSHILGALTSFLAGNTTNQNTARDNYDTGAGAAFGQSVANAPNNPLYIPGASGATYSTDASGNSAITAGPGGSALVPQQANSRVKLANGYSLVYGPDGKALYFLDPSGKRVGS